MKTESVFVYGASGHGVVVADILLARNDLRFLGFVDDSPEMRGKTVVGVPVLGTGDWLREQARRTQIGVALGVGDNHARKNIALKCESWGIEVISAVHPAASVSRWARLGRGSVVIAFGAVNAQAVIGQGCIINTGAVVDHDAIVGDFAHISPNAAMGGAASLGSLSHLGIGAVIIQCVRVGSGCIIGAGAAVIRDVPDGVVAIGVPAKIQREA